MGIYALKRPEKPLTRVKRVWMGKFKLRGGEVRLNTP